MLKVLLLPLWLLFHPVHVSLLSIDYAPEKEVFNVFLRIYYDDFLLDSGISADDQKKLDFSDNSSYTDEVLKRYIDSKLMIFVNGKMIPGWIEKKDLSDNELRMNLVFRPVKIIKSVTVKNLIMTSLYADQANMTILKVNEFEQGVKLSSEMTEMTFKINKN